MYTTEVSWHVVSELRKTKGDQQGVLQGMTGGALAWGSWDGWGTTGSSGSSGIGKIPGMGDSGGLQRGAGTGRAGSRALDGNSRAALWGALAQPA